MMQKLKVASGQRPLVLKRDGSTMSSLQTSPHEIVPTYTAVAAYSDIRGSIESKRDLGFL